MDDSGVHGRGYDADADVDADDPIPPLALKQLSPKPSREAAGLDGMDIIAEAARRVVTRALGACFPLRDTAPRANCAACVR